MLYIIILEYVILALINFFLLQKLDMKFIHKEKGNDVELTEFEKQWLLIIMSVLWIIYLPQLYFNSKERNKK